MASIGSCAVKSFVHIIALVALAASAGLIGLTGNSTCGMAQSLSCRASCLAQYNECRLSTKGSPICDSHYQACLQSCLAR